MKVGVTLLFKEEGLQKIKGILKSTVIETNNNFIKSAENLGNEIGNYYKFKYLGINDLFVVSGDPKEGELLGRTTFYELDNHEKSMTLILDDFSFLKDSLSKTFNCSLVYFCENNDNEKYTISVLSIVNSSDKKLIPKIISLANSNDFLIKIKSNSLENIKKIEFIGIENIYSIDLKFNVFQSFYSDFDNIETLKDELLSNDKVEDILKDITRPPLPHDQCH